MKIFENYSLLAHNTFKIEAKCKYFVESDNVDEFLDFVNTYDVDIHEALTLGGGSDFLFTEDFDGIVFYPTMNDVEIVSKSDDDVIIKVGAGMEWDELVKWSVGNNLYGLEYMSYIPGHVGAAPVQNVGAYGSEAADVITKVYAIDIENAKLVEFSASQCEFSYRNSRFKGEWKNMFIITHVEMKLSLKPKVDNAYESVKRRLESEGKSPTLKSVREAVIAIRREKLPDVDVVPSAGSFFKNPIVSEYFAEKIKSEYPDMPTYPMEDGQAKLAAGWMIDSCGWRGKSMGRAGVYENQALVLVNRGGATGQEIVCLANAIKKSVFMKFGVMLEPEVYVM